MNIKTLYDSYKYGDHEEQILIAMPRGEKADSINQHILFIPPLFAEMNKMRHTIVQTMRLIARYGIKASLPDLPGCHESIADIRKQSLYSWHSAMRTCAEQISATHIVSIRGASLIDDLARPTWRLNGVNGANILKTMLRSKAISLKEAGQNISIDQLTQEALVSGIELAGYDISAEMFSQLQQKQPVRSDNIVEGKVGEHIQGSTIWMRSEPQYDEALAASLAETLVAWCQA